MYRIYILFNSVLPALHCVQLCQKKEEVYSGAVTLVTKQLLGNVFKTFQNGWILVEMLSFLLIVFRFFLMEFQLVFIHENQQPKTNINEMFENGCK